MQTTANLGLRKPESTDTVNIADLNYNADVIDNAITSRPTINTATVTVPAAGGTVTVTGMTATAVVWVAPAPLSVDAWAESGCRCTAQGTDSLTFTVDATASTTIDMNVAWM